MVTGESRPVARGTGDPVTAGTVATDSGLRVEVTATGVETEAQLALLREAGCTGAQGFLLGRPVPFGEVLAVLGGAGFGEAVGCAKRSCA